MTYYEGVLTARSSIAHGGQVLGTVQYLRREKFLLRDGIEEIPVISGNALRGALRDFMASSFHNFVDNRELSIPLAQALWSGGAVTKARGLPLTGERLRKIRQACPPLAILGWGSAGRIVSGSLSIGKLVPICEELTHIIPEYITENINLRSYWDLTQLEEFSRFPDIEVNDVTDSNLLMRYGVESFVAGTQFYYWANLDSRNSIEEACWNEAQSSLLEGRIQVGGLKGRGYGRLTGKLTSPIIPMGLPWTESLLSLATKEEIIEILGQIQ